MGADAASPWAFIDEGPGSPELTLIAGMRFDGPGMVASLRRSPLVPFKGLVIDFNAGTWDFGGVTDAPVEACLLRVTFRDAPYRDVLKLYLLCCLVWRRGKVQTVCAHVRSLDRSLERLGAAERGLRFVTAEDFEAAAEGAAGLSASFHTTSSRQLCRLFEFYETYFEPLADPGLIPALDRFSRAAAGRLNKADGRGLVPDAYLDPLLDACRAAIGQDGGDFTLRMAAAAILLTSQAGFRTSELCSLEAGRLEREGGIPGCPDLVYLTYRTYKGGKGDGGYRTGRTIMNGIALEGYLWLERNCAALRERLGVRTLIVSPRQTKARCTGSALNSYIKGFILSRADEVPCIGTAASFPELECTTVEAAARCYGGVDSCRRLGLDPGDEFVYPVVHQFRVTVATKLYEAGVDMHYISRHMNHLNEETTAGYIRSDRAIERAASETVYRALIGDGAKLIGPHGDEFAAKVEAYVGTLDGKVKADLDEVVRAAAGRYPLRRKVGGVCIRCGEVAPCRAAGGTDDIYCAFGVCPNQCHLYYMAASTYEAVKGHMELVDANLGLGRAKAAANELRKAQNVARGALLPELEDLRAQVAAHGAGHVLGEHPEVGWVIERLDDVFEEVEAWTRRSI